MKRMGSMTNLNAILYLRDIRSGVDLIFCENSKISYPLHNHVSVFTIGMVLEGSIVLNTDCSSQIYRKNQIFTIPPYMPHGIKANNNYTLVSVCIQKDLLNSFNYDMCKTKSSISNLLISVLDSNRINQMQIDQLLSYLYSFGYDILTPGLGSIQPYIENLKQQLELHPESRFSLAEMAHTASTSKYHLIRCFKQAVGLTPHQFQLQNRIRKAQRLIYTVDSITEVALITGFCDQSHFIKQFKKYVGLTPTIYKRSCGVFNHESVLSLVQA